MIPPDPAQLWASLPADARKLLTRLRQLAGPRPRLALVGGAVRDLLLGQASAAPDLDIVLAGGDVQQVAEQLGAAFSWHPAYGNAGLHLPGGIYADLVTARRESYPLAGGPPMPLPGSLEDDLARRDFTVNALALELPADGQLTEGGARLLGVPNSLDDLEARLLRPLHPQSFHEDASRLVRGARLAARLGLHAHAELLAQVPAALDIAPRTPRLLAELRLLLDEPLPGKAARVLEDWGAGELLPIGAVPLLERLDALLGPKSRTLYAAALHSLPWEADRLEALGLGQRPAELLARARSAVPAAPGSPEATLQSLLNLTPPYPPLQGRDLLRLGLSAGPELGRMLGWLAEERRAGRVASADEERGAVRARLKADGPGR